jgi:hypothetical protein
MGDTIPHPTSHQKPGFIVLTADHHGTGDGPCGRQRFPSLALIVATLIGGTLAAGAAGTR